MNTVFVNTGLDDAILKSIAGENPNEELVKALNKEGLVQKEIQVRGKSGKMYTRKQWVRAGEEVKEPKQSKGGGDVDKAVQKRLKTLINNPGEMVTVSGVDYNTLMDLAEEDDIYGELLESETDACVMMYNNGTKEKPEIRRAGFASNDDIFTPEQVIDHMLNNKVITNKKEAKKFLQDGGYLDDLDY